MPPQPAAAPLEAGWKTTRPRSHYTSVPGFRRKASDAQVATAGASNSNGREPTLLQELPNMALLVLLYLMQGIPLGLTMGSMPLLLASKASFTQVRHLTARLAAQCDTIQRHAPSFSEKQHALTHTCSSVAGVQCKLPHLHCMAS